MSDTPMHIQRLQRDASVLKPLRYACKGANGLTSLGKELVGVFTKHGFAINEISDLLDILISTGTDEQLQKCMRRLEPDEHPDGFVMEPAKVKNLYNIFDIVRHTKSEHNYIITGTPEFNQLTSPRSPAYTYKREDGSEAVTYIRPKEQMEDGRFVLVKEYVPSPLKLTGTASSIVILNELG